MTYKEAVLMMCEGFHVDATDETGKPRNDVKIMGRWLKLKLQEKDLDEFVLRVLERVDAKMLRKNVLPSLYDLSQVLKPELESEAAAWFEKLMDCPNSYRDFVTDNPRLQAAVIRLGGWIAICNSLIDDQKYMRKDFIHEYCNCNPSTIEMRQLPGRGTMGKIAFYGDEPDKLQLEGNQNLEVIEELQQIISNK
jgi:hypothetical protein